MGRFDALTQIEVKPLVPNPLPVAHSPAPKKPTVAPAKKQSNEGKKPEIMKSRKLENISSPAKQGERPEKYSTLLDPLLAKKIKIFAAEKEIQNYEVIALALREYFEKHQ